MNEKRIHRNLNRSAEDVARLKAVRERYQKEKPTVEQLLAEGGHAETIPLGDLLFLDQITLRFKKERLTQKLSLADLAERTGMDPAALSRLENGKQANPTVETLTRVAKALGKKLVCDLQDA